MNERGCVIVVLPYIVVILFTIDSIDTIIIDMLRDCTESYDGNNIE